MRKIKPTWACVLLLALALSCAGCTSGTKTTSQAEADRPNIIVILVDDMGYSDIGCYGGEVNTPNLDALADYGVKFSQFYNAARCCPTRASLMTGLYPHQAGIGFMATQDFGRPGYRADLNTRCITIAQALQPAGYQTFMAGKWHISRDFAPDGQSIIGRCSADSIGSMAHSLQRAASGIPLRSPKATTPPRPRVITTTPRR